MAAATFFVVVVGAMLTERGIDWVGGKWLNR